MKKLTLAFLLNLSVCSCLLAQVSVGAKVGGALTNHVYEGIGFTGEFTRLKSTFLVGGFVDVPLTTDFSLRPELIYISKGLKIKTGENGRRRHNLHYLSLPIMLQYHVSDNLAVEVGPEISYLLNDTDQGNTTNLPGQLAGRFVPPYRNIDLGIDIGLNHYFTDHFFVGIRYNLGLYDVSEDYTIAVVGQDTPVQVSGPVYNRSLQLSVGYRLF